jgi:hypothetical protein
MNSSLYRILAVLVPGSVECERGFSVLNEIKDDLRNRLKDEHLEAAMRVALTAMDARTLFSKHKEILIKNWRDLKVRRTDDRGDIPWNDANP